MFDIAAIPDTTILLADGRVTDNSNLVAPAPHWLSNDPDGLKRLIEDIIILKKYPADIRSYGTFTYSEKGPLGIPSLSMEAPNFEYRTWEKENKDFLSLASMACHRLDFIARKAGDWGPECKVTKIIEPPTKGHLTQSTLPGARIGDYIYTINELGKDHVRYILENGTGKKINVTVYFNNVIFVPEAGPEDDTSIQPSEIVAILGRTAEPTAANSSESAAGFSLQNVLVSFAKLEGAALGQTTGQSITLDDNATGHGWYIDYTPYLNEEYLPTAGANVWQAKPGSEAEGKMDMLSVLLHEYGHVLGIEHSK